MVTRPSESVTRDSYMNGVAGISIFDEKGYYRGFVSEIEGGILLTDNKGEEKALKPAPIEEIIMQVLGTTKAIETKANHVSTFDQIYM